MTGLPLLARLAFARRRRSGGFASMASTSLRTARPAVKPAPAMSEGEREPVIALRRDPQLLDRVLADFEAAGVTPGAARRPPPGLSDFLGSRIFSTMTVCARRTA